MAGPSWDSVGFPDLLYILRPNSRRGKIVETIGASEARRYLPKLLDRVGRGESLTITRYGESVARLIPAATDRERAREALDCMVELRKHI